ncbi:MAG: hypothetical protein V7L23_20715 [Nostoc sp.]|uniref:hypothetical protein n=1 Tax=Nostoc sp. TaxID=1180 RepID=UPI002FEF1ABB
MRCEKAEEQRSRGAEEQRSRGAEEQRSRGEKPRHLRVGLQPRKLGSYRSTCGRGFEPYLFRKWVHCF